MTVPAHSLFDLTPPGEAAQPYPALCPGLAPGRGWHAGDTSLWTRAPEAELLVDTRLHPPGTPLLTTLRLPGAGPACPTQLRIDSPGHAPLSITSPVRGPVSLHLPSPQPQAGSPWGVMTLAVDRMGLASDLGPSQDTRRLGLGVLRVVPDPDPLRFPLDFTGRAAAEGLLVSGWATPDPGSGVWTEGPRARLRLPGALSPGGPCRLTLELDALPRPDDTPRLRLTVTSAGWPLLQCDVAPGRSEVTVPVPSLPGWPHGADLMLDLACTHILSPADVGLSPDARRLGVMLRHVSLSPDGTK